MQVNEMGRIHNWSLQLQPTAGAALKCKLGQCNTLKSCSCTAAWVILVFVQRILAKNVCLPAGRRENHAERQT